MEKIMKPKTPVRELAGQLSRRGLLRTGAAAALLLSADSLEAAMGQPGGALTDYGTTPLKPENIFPLFSAWLLFTTNGPFTVDADLLSCAARLHPDSAKKISKIFDDNATAFKPVRDLFEQIAKDLSAGQLPYSGGQCPKVADTVTPVAGLVGTPTTVACHQAANSPKKPK